MRIYARPRYAGKTTEAIKLAAANNAYLIVRSKDHAIACQQRAKEAGLDILFPITFFEFLQEKWRGRKDISFVIDDADDLLRTLARGHRIHGLTLTDD